MKKIAMSIFILLVCTTCIGPIFLNNSSEPIEANISYTDKEAVKKSFEGYMNLVNSDEKELWGYEAEDNLEDLWIGDPLPLYDFTDVSVIELTNYEVYPIYSGENIRTCIEMEGDAFRSAFWFGYMQDNIIKYNEIKSQKPNVSDYNIVMFWEQYLLFYQENGETYFIGSTRLFDWPTGEGEPCRLDLLAEAIQKRADYYNETCPEHNCY